MPSISRALLPAKLLSLALALAIGLGAVVGVIGPRARVAYAVAVPVTATGFAGQASTSVGPSTALATINNDATITPGTTALVAGNAIIIQFPAGTTLTGANIATTDFTIQQAVWTGGGGPVAGGALAPTGVVVGATTLTFTVAAGSLSTGGGAGQGLVTIATSATATGNEITRPAAAGTYAVGVSTPLDFGTTTAVIGTAVTITSIVPGSGSTAGGTSVTITGTGFTGVTSVTFGGVAATITGSTATTITLVTPAFVTPSLVTVIVAAPAGTANTTFTYFTAITVPSAPQLVTAVAGDGQATATWIAPANNGGSAIIDYTVTASPGGQTLIVGGLSATFTGLTNGTAYTFTVTARNSAGSGPALSSSSVTPVGVPGAPSGVTATAGDKQATVTWTAPSSTGGSAIIDYTVTANPGGQTATVSGTSATVTGLTNGTAYNFTVKARNSAGTGSASGSSNSVTPKAAGPTATPNGGFWSPGLNGMVIEGTSSPSAAATQIQLQAQRAVLALWMLSGGLWQFYLPTDPGVSTLTFLPGTLAALIAVLS